MPTIISIKGVWSAAHNTQAAVHEVNRPGYQGAPKAAAKPAARKATEQQTASKAE
jgi:hypothetical protein